MPKRRVPGHLHRRPRRRDDARPNLPAAPTPGEPAMDAELGSDPAPAAAIPAGRPLRPTQRIGGASRFVRSAAPPPEVELDYGQVIGDLRQIAIWAALAFAILIALAFVIR
ncbi:MAG TPA: hypothetical protein VGL23_13040 [Chloroflexota bacterium]